MASTKTVFGALFIASFYLSASIAFPPGHHEGAYPVGNSPTTGLSPDYYKFTCPQADEIVVSILKKAIAKEPRIAASLLRLLFHDCFVQSLFCILTGSHTIGKARCVSFKQRLYNQHRDNRPDNTLEKGFYHILASACPRTGGDNSIQPLDFVSPSKFDNSYYKLILEGKGLLNSDEVLWTGKDPEIAGLVKSYAENEPLFFEHYVNSIIKMGNINPLVGYNGEIRKNCRRVNQEI